tara:strand:+ start:11716 stop:13494 length:1779 start_codon:yes stop_codon:yes gene_type:complete
MLVAVLRRGSRATTARECAHLTGSWSKDVHINPSSTIAERALSRVDTNPCSPLPPTRRCRSSSSSAGDKRSGAHERSWAASSIGGSHGASPDPRKITAQLKYAQGARAILANVGNHLEKLNPIHASFALNLLGKDASRNRKGQLRDLLRNDGAFAGLLQLTKRFATEFPARNLANALHGIAKLCANGALKARGATTVEVIDALDAALVKCAGDLEPQGTSTVWWAYAILGRQPSQEAAAALASVTARDAHQMWSQHVGNIWWALGSLIGGERLPSGIAVAKYLHQNDEMWRGLIEAAKREAAKGMRSQELANLAWSLATTGRVIDEDLWAIVQKAIAKGAGEMNAHAVSTIWWAHATSGRLPDGPALTALCAATERSAREAFNAQDVATTVWSLATLSSLRGMPLPRCYDDAWKIARDMQPGQFHNTGLCKLFHAYLMRKHGLSVGDKGEYPVWIINQAKDAWMMQVRDLHDLHASHTHQNEIAGVFRDHLKLNCEVEWVTDGGYFSVDVYLPDGEVAVEYDGPGHFVGTGRDQLRWFRSGETCTKTAATELRDLFLTKTCAGGVISIPWFEWKDAENQDEYLRRKLDNKIQ